MVGAHVSLKEKSNFNPERGAIVVPKVGFKGLKMSKFEERAKNSNPRENVICKVSRLFHFLIFPNIVCLPVRKSDRI